MSLKIIDWDGEDSFTIVIAVEGIDPQGNPTQNGQKIIDTLSNQQRILDYSINMVNETQEKIHAMNQWKADHPNA